MRTRRGARAFVKALISSGTSRKARTRNLGSRGAPARSMALDWVTESAMLYGLSGRLYTDGPGHSHLYSTAADTVFVKEPAYAKIAVVYIRSLGLARERAACPKYNRNLAGHPEGQWAQRLRGPAHGGEDLARRR